MFKEVEMNIFAQRLKEMLNDKKMSQSGLARFLKVRQQTVNSWCNAVSCPDFYTLIELCKLFDVSSDYLLGISDDF